MTYANNTAINITDIGVADSEAVLCRTDLTSCCTYIRTGHLAGDWIYPNGTEVRNRRSSDDIFRTRGDMVVRLHRMDNVTSPTGQYCCEVPTMANPSSNRIICIILCELAVLHLCTHIHSRDSSRRYIGSVMLYQL